MNLEFPFKTALSLDNLISHWEQKQISGGTGGKYAGLLLEELNQYPELRGNISDISILEKHRELIESLLSAIFPDAVSDDAVHAAFVPFSMDYFYGSKKFHHTVAQAGCIGNMVNEMALEEMAQTKIVSAYQSILSKFYNINFPGLQNFPLSLREESGLTRYYHLSLNPKFCDIKLHGKLPKFSETELGELVDKITDLPTVMKLLPPKLFEFRGFGIYTMTDATNDEVISRIKESLLKKSSISRLDSFLDLQENFRSLLGQAELMIGLSPYSSRKKSGMQTVNNGSRSLMSDIDDNFIEPFFNVNQKLLVSGEPYIIKNIEEDPIFRHYINQVNPKIKSAIFCPLSIGDELVGVLEIASPKKDAFSIITFTRLSEIIPLFAIAINRHLEEHENRIQSIIKENYTSIHPTVEWKFTEAAYKILDQEEKGQKPDPEEIIFKNVYPLYAASDIRNSSLIRSEAIVSDLTTQLRLAKEVLSHAEDEVSFPLIGELNFRISQSIASLKKGMVSGDESGILHFIKHEVEPVIKSLEQELDGFGKKAEKYWSRIDPNLKVLYEKRKDFESSLTRINELIADFLEREQEKAQKVYPHYFEKYKTDGVEYNAYIGPSITRSKKFNLLHLKNLRLWQLMATIEIARKTALLKKDLPVALDTTHLILVHSQPLSVSFRMDEKQFDVDGAYNIRYEIVKKRIDKVRIKDSRERLTQPNKIAVVFSGGDDPVEYLQYFEYMKSKGLIAPQIERMDLEELQGVIGLKALRVTIEPGQESFMDELEQLKKTTLA